MQVFRRWKMHLVNKNLITTMSSTRDLTSMRNSSNMLQIIRRKTDMMRPLNILKHKSMYSTLNKNFPITNNRPLLPTVLNKYKDKNMLMTSKQYSQKSDISEALNDIEQALSGIDKNTKIIEDKIIKEAMKKEGFGARLRYFLLRQNRPFNVDEITAFFSWILMGNFIWIFIGTTTFFGVLIYIVNWLDDGEIERILLKKLLTFDNKLNIDLSDQNFKASWEDGKIKIRNLKVLSNPIDSEKEHLNYKLFISEINLTLSFNKWLDGYGLIDTIEIEGLQGDVNIFDGDELILDDSFNDRYELNHIKVKHSKINFHSEKFLNKPIELVVFNCDMDRLRRSWMVYDFLNANTMFGSLDGSLFTLHKRQHRFAHFSGMDLHNETDDYNNVRLNTVNEDRAGYCNKIANDGGKSEVCVNNKNNNTSNNNENIVDGDLNDEGGDDLWKKITRLRIDMLDLSFLNNENSKLNWINSGKAEVIIDIMLPNEEETSKCHTSREKKIQFSIEGFKKMCDSLYKKLLEDDYYGEDGNDSIEINKYVVIDMKIKYYNLSARLPEELPCSSLTGLPYMTWQDLQSLVTFINDEKFGLSSSKFVVDHNEEGSIEKGNEIDSDELLNEDDTDIDDAASSMGNSDDGGDGSEDKDIGGITNGKMRMLPPIKFRIVQNLKDFEYVDLPSLLSFSSMKKPDADMCDERVMKSFVNTNKFIDNSIIEVLALLLVYKEEIQTRLIDMYSRRSGFEILFNNFILGNLILVGLGSFVI